LEHQADTGSIDAVRRFYEPEDLDGARLVIAATDDEATNEAVWRGARARGCLVNVVDDPARCNFHVPAVVRRGALTIAVSTGGNSPLLARRTREALEEEFDGAYEPYLALLGELRPLIQAQVTDTTRRRALWAALLDSEILELLRSGASEAARRCAEEILEAYI
jgi:precorrin-2 dehydrogenase/sirohydrochlorin ferrochelatase